MRVFGVVFACVCECVALFIDQTKLINSTYIHISYIYIYIELNAHIMVAIIVYT